jgi:hypothetical protein
MPHVNALLGMTGGLKVLTEDEIWKNTEMVQNELPSSKIVSGFVQASRIYCKGSRQAEW